MLLTFPHSVLGVDRSDSLPEEAQPVQSAVQQAVETAMKRLGRFSFRRIDVVEANGVVTLKGEVRSWFQKQLAQHTAMQTSGVRRVLNELRVDPRGGTPGF